MMSVISRCFKILNEHYGVNYFWVFQDSSLQNCASLFYLLITQELIDYYFEKAFYIAHKDLALQGDFQKCPCFLSILLITPQDLNLLKLLYHG